ncbi:MAG: anaerobic ribonucleoside-triphosphate reductase activating protein [Thermodesulfobacteriota bacterium]
MIQIKGFLETSFIDWHGKIVSVIFLPYCNFRCPYCHNQGLVLTPEKYESISIEYILNRLDKFRGWIDGICITGGEPTLHTFLPEFIRKLRAQNFLIKLDTNGTNPHVLKNLLSNKLIDYISMDVKAPLDEIRYSKCAGVPVNLKDIRESMSILKGGTVPYEFRVTVVPGLLGEDDIIELAEQLVRPSKLTIQNFNPSNPLDPELKHIKPYDEEELKRIQERVSKILQTSNS